jgi:hypothetical protein
MNLSISSQFECRNGSLSTFERLPRHVRSSPHHVRVAAIRVTSALCRLCCKSRRLRHSRFVAKTQNRRQLPIRAPSMLPKSPASLTREDVSPHVFTRKPRLQPAEFSIIGARGLLQQYQGRSRRKPKAGEMALLTQRRAWPVETIS